ncbi:unnamed protein product [Sphagnum jensenii]|uniref:Uncharacterized protein n=1 Tax=Sphagnum jensenii TaxID=128206 RepID=A0ABP1BRR2_9BRYO
MTSGSVLGGIHDESFLARGQYCESERGEQPESSGLFVTHGYHVRERGRALWCRPQTAGCCIGYLTSACRCGYSEWEIQTRNCSCAHEAGRSQDWRGETGYHRCGRWNSATSHARRAGHKPAFKKGGSTTAGNSS